MNDILAFLRECLGIFSMFMVFIFNHKSLNEHEQLRVGLFLFINTCGRVFTAPILLFYTLKLSEKLCSKIAPITGCLCSTVTVNSAFTVICPIAIAYSMEQIMKPVCLCSCASLCACTLTLAFLGGFSPILAQRYKNPTSSLGVNIAPLFPLPPNPPF